MTKRKLVRIRSGGTRWTPLAIFDVLSVRARALVEYLPPSTPLDPTVVNLGYRVAGLRKDAAWGLLVCFKIMDSKLERIAE